MCLAYEILLCIDPSAATSESTREILEAPSRNIYELRFYDQCAEALRKSYYALIHLPLRLEVLANFLKLLVEIYTIYDSIISVLRV